jgi:hypothetical protein
MLRELNVAWLLVVSLVAAAHHPAHSVPIVPVARDRF